MQTMQPKFDTISGDDSNHDSLTQERRKQIHNNMQRDVCFVRVVFVIGSPLKNMHLGERNAVGQLTCRM